MEGHLMHAMQDARRAVWSGRPIDAVTSARLEALGINVGLLEQRLIDQKPEEVN